ncbi:hypothetical protein PIB30_079935 [Stylosanthes scabra]|uniref:Uncharacterized protein n=1 Tax=Stylosanthes scabra TaxID=79078 RepID=A0ABU6XTG1_9FABA|nr:hypothetical protein [Stylosanthes scabra]
MFNCHEKIAKKQVMELCIELGDVRGGALSSCAVRPSQKVWVPPKPRSELFMEVFESDEEWVSTSSDGDSDDDADRALVPSHYETLDLDVMQLDVTPFGSSGPDNYNPNGSVKLRVGHRL